MHMPDFAEFAAFLESHPEYFRDEWPRLTLFECAQWPPTQEEFTAILDENNRQMIQAATRHVNRMLFAYHQWLSGAADP